MSAHALVTRVLHAQPRRAPQIAGLLSVINLAAAGVVAAQTPPNPFANQVIALTQEPCHSREGGNPVNQFANPAGTLTQEPCHSREGGNPGNPFSTQSKTLLEDRPVSWKLVVPNLLHDQKNIWLFPVRVAQGRHWKPALGFVAATAGLVALDPFEAPYFRNNSTYGSFNQAFSGRNTVIGMTALPAAFYAVSLARHNRYDQHTSLFIGEAVADSELLAAVMKAADRRLRPGDVAKGGNFSDTFFDGRPAAASFPSGHTVAAFSIATVFVNRYPRHRWVPWVAYGLAGAVGFSRITLQSHFTSDVFAGAVLGYAISHYVVLGPQ